MIAEVLRPGLLSTVQDLGRTGYRALGVGPGGVMDEFAARVASWLVGNEDVLPVIEFFQTGPVFQFDDDALIAVCGSDVVAEVDGKVVSIWQPVHIGRGASIKLHTRAGVGYIAVHGGWSASSWLGSASTHVQSGMGGHQGRALRKGDLLSWQETNGPKSVEHASGGYGIPEHVRASVYDQNRHLLCMPGPEAGLLPEEIRNQFVSQAFRCTSSVNRMGFRLSGESLHQDRPLPMVSSAVNRGTVQLLPDGQVIVLMADHQTTGGYPRIATLIRAEWPRFNRLTAGAPGYFAWTTPELAWSMLQDREGLMNKIKSGCLMNFRRYFYKP